MDEMTKRNIIMDNYQNPYHKEEHKEYDETLLNELIVYDKIYLQPNRVTCALLPFKSIKEYLMEKEK